MLIAFSVVAAPQSNTLVPSSPVGREYILKHYRAYGGPEPAAIDHQGINDSFVGKASVVRYFHAGKWLELTGAD
jgi:hypothetical protein